MKIEYKFKNEDLLQEALTHPSYCKGKHSNKPNYQRLEFLGDAILSSIIAEYLYKKYHDMNEGELSISQSHLVKTSSLADVARSIDLGESLLLDIGEEKNNGRDKDRNLENAMEALIAAVYLDSDFLTVKTFISNLWADQLDNIFVLKNSKSLLQEWAQKNGKPIPKYTTIETSGSQHEPIFKVQVDVNGLDSCIGKGKSKKVAEHDAATQILKLVKEQ